MSDASALRSRPGLAALASKPWDSYPVPDQIYLPRGMIGFEERRMLFWLAAEHYTGAGAVVDAGAYLGASAFCLAAGLAASNRVAARDAVVHVYDRFIATDEYVRNDISHWFYPVSADYDFYRIFEYQTALCAKRIVAHRGDFLTTPSPKSDIEVLFIDVAKNTELNHRLIEQYFTRLIPGRSVVVQQDYYQAWYPHIPITMEYLGDCLAMADGYVDVGSRVYFTARKIPNNKLQRLLEGLDVEEQARLLRRAIAKEQSLLNRMMLRVVEILHMVDLQGEHDRASKAAEALRTDREFDPAAYYATQLDLVLQSRALA